MNSIHNNANSLRLQSQKDFVSIKIASKNEPAYKKEMDFNENDEVTFDEFMEYCDENKIISPDTDTTMKAMLNAKLMQEIAQKREESKQKEKIEQEYEQECEQEAEEESKQTSNKECKDITTGETKNFNFNISFAFKQALKAYNTS